MQESYRRINSSLSKIERKLLIALKRFYNKYIRNSINPVEITRQQRGGYIYELLKETVRKALFVNAGVSFVLTKEITQNIFNLINQNYEQFWKTVSRLRLREDELKTVQSEQIVEPATIPEKVYKPELDVEASLIGFTAYSVFLAFNTGILLFVLDSGQREQVTFMTVGDKKVDKKMCRPLHGRTFYADDPLLPKPPLHVHCRCMLLPSI